MGVIVLLLTMSTLAAPPVESSPAESSVLSDRLALIKEGNPFLELGEETIAIYVAGWKVKEFAATIHQITVGERTGVTAVDEVIPLSPPRRVVLDSAVLAQEAADPTGDVASLDQIIGVDEMPSIFLVRFDDGTVWLVNFRGWQGFSNAWSKSRLQWQVLLDVSGRLFRDGRARTRFVEMEPQNARELFWVLEKGMKTLQ